MDNESNLTPDRPAAAETAPSFSRGRSWGVGFHVGLSVAAMLALVVMANYLASRHFARWHWAGEGRQGLSPMTLQVLRSLTNQVRVVVFFDPEESPSLYSAVVGLLDEYQAVCPRLEVQKIDYMRQPDRANLIKDKYKLTLPEVNQETSFRNLVVFDCPGRLPRVVYERQLSEYDFSGLFNRRTNEVKRVGFNGESLFTEALIKVLDPHQNKAYFLRGHGEYVPSSEDEQWGYSRFATNLQQNSIQVESLTLGGATTVPADCRLLIIAGAKAQIEPSEIEKIDQYLKQGGRLLVLFRPLVNCGLQPMLSNWGIEVGDDLVLDEPNKVGDIISFKVTNFSTTQPIMKPLFDCKLQLVTPRSVAKKRTGQADADAPRVEELAFTSPSGRAVTDVSNGEIHPSTRDRQGVIPLIVSLEKGSLPGVSGDRGTTRMVVAGDSWFLGNQGINSGENRDFGILAVNWLLDRPRLMGGIGPRPVREYRVSLTRAQQTTLNWIMLAGLPGGVLGLGGLVWLRRRH